MEKTIKDTEDELSLLKSQNSLLISTLLIFEDVCSTCLNASGAHDENGEVDMLDEIGQMICGTPFYPANITLKRIESNEQ